MRVRSLIYFIRLGRPLFLVGGFLFHGLGVSIALYQGATFIWSAFLWGQVAITAIQIMTHYSNDYFDLAADQANLTPTRWSGGSRILVEGRLPANVALFAALGWGVVALLAITVLTVFIRPAILTPALLLLALILAWEYSAPPLRLHSRGLGELTVGLIVPGLTPLVGYWLQVGQPDSLPFLSVLPLVSFQMGMILIINIPDAAGDRQTGKRTLLLRLGAEPAMTLCLALFLLPYMLLPLLVYLGLPGVVALSCLLPFPLAVWQGWRIKRGQWQLPEQWNSLGFCSIVLLVGTAVCETLAFWWLAAQF